MLRLGDDGGVEVNRRNIGHTLGLLRFLSDGCVEMVSQAARMGKWINVTIKTGNKSFKMMYNVVKDSIGISEKNISFGVRVCSNQNFDVNVGARSVCKRAYMCTRTQEKLFESTFECSVDLGGV